MAHLCPPGVSPFWRAAGVLTVSPKSQKGEVSKVKPDECSPFRGLSVPHKRNTTSPALQSVPLQAHRANLPTKGQQPLAGVALSREQDSFRILNKRDGRQQVGVCCQSSGMCEARKSVSLSMGSVCPFPWDQCVPLHGIFVSLSMGSVHHRLDDYLPSLLYTGSS